VLYAENGLQGLKTLEKEPIDCMFLDISMPVMNGIEVLEAIRHDEKLKDLPTMMISGVASKEVIMQLVELKVFDYILKPLLKQETVPRIQNFMEYVEKHKNRKKSALSSTIIF